MNMNVRSAGLSTLSFTAGLCVRLMVLAAFLIVPAEKAHAAERLRVIVETDAGGDPDDEQSLVRFLLYANEWEVVGIIANRPQARDVENRNTERTGLGIVQRMIRAYGQCYANLQKHDPRYPTPEKLLSRAVAGYADVDDGVQLILNEVLSNGPVWFMNWGTDHGSSPSCLKRTLDRILSEHGPERYANAKSKIRLASDDQFGDHTFKIDPPFPIWVDTFRPPVDGKRWYHQFSAITAKAGGFDLLRDVLNHHGPLGALYPTNTTHWQKEGDSGTFLYLVPTGMNDPDQPGWGSWAGRYGPRDGAAGKPYFWANQPDTWRGTTHRDNSLRRWAAHLQNDFRARLDWCVKSFDDANHRPVARLNGGSGRSPTPRPDGSPDPGILTIPARRGVEAWLSAAGSSDPDNDTLKYEWELYPEAGTYHGKAALVANPSGQGASIKLDESASGDLHVILTVTDNGAPPLVAYRRAVIRVAP